MLGRNMAEIYDYCCLHYRRRTAIVAGEERYSFEQLAETANRLADSLSGLGLAKGDRVGMLLPNCPAVIFGDYACAKAGLVILPMAAYLGGEDMEFMLRETGARAIIYHHGFQARVEELAKGVDSLEHLICVADNGAESPRDIPPGHHDFHELVRRGSPEDNPATPEEDDLYAIFYSGGTTGTPKGVLHSHRSFSAVVTMQLLDFDIAREEVLLAVTPLTHAARPLVHSVFLRGGSCVILNGFDPARLLAAIEREKVTTSFIVPTMIYALLDFPDREKYDLTSLRNVIYGASPIAPERLREAVRTFGPIFTQLYGQAEAPMVLAAFPRHEHLVEGGDEDLQRLASCGRPTLATRLRLLDEENREVALGQPGEMVVKCPNMMLGYLNRPDLTAETIRDGWLHTGDVAYQDKDGFLYIVDRKKDMIVSGGFNVYPKEVEDILHEHPAVSRAAVIGVPDSKWGETVKAVVVSRPGAEVDEAELIEFCKRKKGSVMAPKSVDFVEAIPATPLGKPDKKAIRQGYWKDRERQVG